jgi:hypothetical protein
VALLAVLSAGCAVNDLGLVRVRHYENDSAFVVALQSWGVQLLTIPGNAGLTLGYSRRTFVFRRDGAAATVPLAALLDTGAGETRPAACDPCPTLASLGRPIFLASKIVGVSLDTNADRVGVALGLRYRTILTLPADGSDAVLLRYESEDDRSPRVIIGKEVD